MPVELNQQALIQMRLQNLKDQQDLIGWLRLYVSVHFNPIYERLEISKEDIATSTDELESILLQIFISMEELLSQPVDYNTKQIKAASYYEVYISILSDLSKYKGLTMPEVSKRLDRLTVYSRNAISYLESRFPINNLMGELKAPLHLWEMYNDHVSIIHNLKLLFDSIPEDHSLLTIIKEELLDEQTSRDLHYMALLGKYLKAIKEIRLIEGSIHTLDLLLVSVNFNSFRFINYISKKILASLDQAPDKGAHLNSVEKLFKQLPQSTQLSFNPLGENVYTYLSRWFSSERNQYRLKENGGVIAFKDTQHRLKIKSTLTVDQLSLILRATYDKEVIITPSMNHLFRIIVPYLSTSERQELSYGSMRSKSYNAEIKDKDATIAILHKLVEAIKDY
ncbi:hypothetical protein ACTJIJ_14795 [Niabella sp. 22666]|uniref:hypothetical protein n=1 Tax=Niabella sp. 22666 TaxID=3453954 RepID=UPI003F84EE58